jgi:Zn-dependent peptidase ImmA (M78 family)
MKNQAFRLKMAKQKAEALLREIGMLELPVDPMAIAEKHDIVVQAKPHSQPGVSGMLLRSGNEFGILYATHIRSEGFQRFSVAHELGHYFLEGHVDHVLAKGAHISHAGFVSADPFEMEADQFAAGLLMPSDLFKRALRKHSGEAIVHWAVARAGAALGAVQASQISFMPAKSLAMFFNQICADRRRLLSVPERARNFSIFARTALSALVYLGCCHRPSGLGQNYSIEITARLRRVSVAIRTMLLTRFSLGCRVQC